MLTASYDDVFDCVGGYSPLQFEAKVFGDQRGSFSEVLVGEELRDIKQINRSKSVKGVVRGCHAQLGKYCQSKIVEAVYKQIYDIITDARPDSKTFGVTAAYLLDPDKQNKLYVPRGFLHAFAVPQYDSDEQAVFMYYCNNTYCKDAEVCISPMSYLPNVVKKLDGDPQYEGLCKLFKTPKDLVLSEKDLAGNDYETWMQNVLEDYAKTGQVWYR